MGNQQAKFPLPEDIITQILLLLPLHSLLACRCVSRQWRDLIKNPIFVKLYEPKCTALFLHKGSLYSLLIPDHDNKKIKPRRLPIGPFNGTRLLVESSNKRACAQADNGDFLVYDLVTGDSYKVVPPLQLRLTLTKTGDWFYHRILSYGFGYDPYTDDFKIVFLASRRIDKYNNGAVDLRCDQGFVHSFNNGGWKSFKGFDAYWYNWGWSPLGYDFNGVLHWVIGHGVVATMDLHSGRLAEIAFPPLPVDYDYNRWLPRQSLGELDGHLCVCCRYGPGDPFDVWVMKEYGVEESWTKLLSIGVEKLRELSARGIVLEWTTPPVLYSIEGGAKVAICLSHHSKCLVFEYDLCEDTIRVMHKTTWVKDKIVRWFQRSFQCHGGAIP